MVNCPILLGNVNAAADIFIKDEGTPQVKTMQSKPYQVHPTYINILWYLMEKYQYFTLSYEFMFVNGIPFFITTSHHIKPITDLMTKYERIIPVIATIKKVKSHDAKYGFCIEEMWIYRQCEPSFEKLPLRKVGISTVSKRYHMPELDRINRTIEERVHDTWNELNINPTKIVGVLIRETVQS